MTTAETARAFTDMLKAGDHEGAAARFNAPDCVSIEAMEGPMARVEGAAAIKAKGEWWYANNTVHSVVTHGPYVNGDQFAVTFDMDVTDNQSGRRVQMTEAALYTVKDGRIVEERFFY
jgi:ketosteroid isomerase-like protein